MLVRIALSSCAYDKDLAYPERSGHRPESEGGKDRGGHGLPSSPRSARARRTSGSRSTDRGEMQKLQGRLEDNERDHQEGCERDLGDQDS